MQIINPITSLISGAIHPAAYVLIGNALHLENAFQNFQFTPENSLKPIEIYNRTLQYLSLEKAKDALFSVGHDFMQVDLGASVSDLRSTFVNHALEWQVAAAWGLTATVCHMILKKTPVIKHHEYLRVGCATLIGAGATLAGYHFGLEQEIHLEIFLSIAYKVAIIGGTLKALNKCTQWGLTATYKSANTISKIIEGGCTIGLATLKFVEWKGPEKIEAPIKKKTKKKEAPSSASSGPKDPPSSVGLPEGSD